MKNHNIFSMLTLIVLTVFLAFSAGCDKDDPSSPDDSNKTVAGSTFMPLADGNYWKYDVAITSSFQLYFYTYTTTDSISGPVEYQGVSAWRRDVYSPMSPFGEELITVYYGAVDDTLCAYDDDTGAWVPVAVLAFLESAEEGDCFEQEIDASGTYVYRLTSTDATITAGGTEYSGCYLLTDSSYVGSSEGYGDLIMVGLSYYVPDLGLVYSSISMEAVYSDTTEIMLFTSVELIDHLVH